MPLILIGISLRFYLTSKGYEPSLFLVSIGQSIFVMPLAILNLSNRMSQIPKNLEEAAWSLGSSRIRSMFEIILPSCKFSLIATCTNPSCPRDAFSAHLSPRTKPPQIPVHRERG